MCLVTDTKMQKLSLQTHHITDLYFAVDNVLVEPAKPRGGRPPALRQSEVVTILVWNALTCPQKTLKAIHDSTKLCHAHDFPRLPPYNRFVDYCHRALLALILTLQSLLVAKAPIRLMDATMLDVCKLARADQHKTAKGVADFGKNWQGWHYGFKLHASINRQGQFCGLIFTPANIYDAQMMPAILNEHTKVAVGDGTYNASKMRQRIARDYHCVVIAPVHPSQKKKIMASWQHLLLLARPKIEAVFDYLKEHMSMVSSFPRSVNGYFLHYLRILLGYQIQALGQEV
jgi:hypothetical protein